MKWYELSAKAYDQRTAQAVDQEARRHGATLVVFFLVIGDMLHLRAISVPPSNGSGPELQESCEVLSALHRSQAVVLCLIPAAKHR